MAYSTVTDLQFKAGGLKALVQLADRTNSGALDADAIAVADNAIAEADALINQYIGKQVFVPIAVGSVPDSIRHLSARIAVYMMRVALRMVDPETHGQQHKNDLEFLDKVKSGDISLGVDPAPVRASARLDAQSERPFCKTVARRALRGFS